MTPDGITRLNSILSQLSQNIAGDTENVRVFQGVGTPEASIAAGVGSLYMRTDGGTDTSIYRKESGSGDTGWVAVKAPATLPLSVANGGLGADNSAQVQGTILYVSATGVISFLATGTSGKFLKTQGAGANPTWDTATGLSNCLFSFSGMSDNSGNQAFITGSSITPAVAANAYAFWAAYNATSSSYMNVINSKWVKIAGVSTVTVYCNIWQSSGVNNNKAQCKVIIGSVNGTVQGTTNQVTPEWKSFTIDVSGLSDGTTYDVTVSLSISGTSNNPVYLGSIIGLGS